MTSSQDQPLTRRELRELERVREQEAALAPPSTDASAPTPPVPPAYSAPPAPAYPTPPAPQQAAPQPFPSYAPTPAQAPTPAAAPAPQAAPLPTFAPRSAGVPVPQSSPFGGPIAAPDPAVGTPTPSAEPLAPIPSAFAPREAPQEWSRPAAQPQARPAPAPLPPAAPTSPASVVPPSAAPVRPEPSRTPERTLTRRELRALIDQSEIAEHEDDADEVFGGLFGDASSGAAPSRTSAPVASAAPAVGAAPAATPLAAANPASGASVAPSMSASAPTAPAAAESPLRVPERDAESVAQPKPVGHWTSQLDQPVEHPEPFDQLLSRGSHGVPTTTNALILPSLPSQGGLSQPLTGGAELIVTGSIELPRSFGATGLHPSHIDSSDIDRLFERVDDGDTGTGVAPVAATSAISTQGGARAVMAPPKKEGLNAPLILAITAGVLALGVVTTLVIGVVAGLF